MSPSSPGTLWIIAELLNPRPAAGMLDEVVVSIAPVTLGSGKPLFGGAFDLQLTGCERNRDFVVVRYDVQGPLTSP